MAFEKDYYTLVASLPEIAWDERKLPLTVQEFREEAKDYVTGKDAALLDLFFLPNDNAQVLRLLNKQEPGSGIKNCISLETTGGRSSGTYRIASLFT